MSFLVQRIPLAMVDVVRIDVPGLRKILKVGTYKQTPHIWVLRESGDEISGWLHLRLFQQCDEKTTISSIVSEEGGYLDSIIMDKVQLHIFVIDVGIID